MTIKNQTIQNLDNISGIQVLDNQDAEKYTGGAFSFFDGILFFEENGSGGNFPIEDYSNRLDIRNTGPNAGNRNDVDHNFVVNFLNPGGRRVATGNVEFGEGVNSDVLERARGLGATRIQIEQREPTSDDECACPALF